MSSLQHEFPSLSIRQLCALLGVSRSWFYGRSHALRQAERDLALRDAIERIVLEFPGYGYRRVTAELHRQHWAANHKRVLRIMRQEALLCQLQRSWIITTDSRHTLRTYPNLLVGLDLQRPNQAWVADITYIRLPTTFVYLACVVDAWSRRCVDWQLSRTIDTQLTLAALNQAIALRQPAAGLIHHSDRGVQYASAAYVERLLGMSARVSMSAKGNPYDNAIVESRNAFAIRCTEPASEASDTRVLAEGDRIVTIHRPNKEQAMLASELTLPHGLRERQFPITVECTYLNAATQGPLPNSTCRAIEQATMRAQFPDTPRAHVDQPSADLARTPGQAAGSRRG